MLNLKKKLLIYKIKKIFNQNSVVFLYHYNSINSKNWSLLKNELSHIKNANTLIIKSRVASLALNELLINLSSTNNSKNVEKWNFSNNQDYQKNYAVIYNKFSQLFQGSTLVVSCQSLEEIPHISNIFKKYNNFIFIGGKVQNQLVTHLDLSHLKNLNNNVYLNLLQEFHSSFKNVLFFNQIINFSFLKIYHYKLLSLLSILEKNLKN